MKAGGLCRRRGLGDDAGGLVKMGRRGSGPRGLWKCSLEDTLAVCCPCSTRLLNFQRLKWTWLRFLPPLIIALIKVIPQLPDSWVTSSFAREGERGTPALDLRENGPACGCRASQLPFPVGGHV